MGRKTRSRTAPPPPEGSTPAPTPAPKKPLRGGLAEELHNLEATVKDLKKKLNSEKSRAESYKRYRDKEKEECLETHDALRKAEKDRDNARDEVKEIENANSKQWTITIGRQMHYRGSREEARDMVKELLDMGIWWVALDREE